MKKEKTQVLKRKDEVVTNEENAVSIKDLCRDELQTIKTFFKSNIISIILIPLCIVISYVLCLRLIGDGSYKYSDETYKYMEDAITGGSEIDIETGEIIQIATDETGKQVYGAVAPNMGFDSAFLKEKDIQSFSFSWAGQQFELVCTNTDGYFVAEVTAIIDEDYTIISVLRNYKSFAEYKNQYDIIFGICTIAGGVGLYLAIIFGWFLVIGLVAIISTVLSNIGKKLRKKHIQEDSKSNVTIMPALILEEDEEKPEKPAEVVPAIVPPEETQTASTIATVVTDKETPDREILEETQTDSAIPTVAADKETADKEVLEKEKAKTATVTPIVDMEKGLQAV